MKALHLAELAGVALAGLVAGGAVLAKAGRCVDCSAHQLPRVVHVHHYTRPADAGERRGTAEASTGSGLIHGP